MATKLISPPLAEPLALPETKAHLRVDSADEDALLDGLITAARTYVELACDRALITQGWAVFHDRWPDNNVVILPKPPLQAVTAVILHGAQGGSVSLEATDYLVDTASQPGRLVRAAGVVWPDPGRRVNGVEIHLSAGYGDSGADIPSPLRQAMLLLVAHWFERREPVVVGHDVVEVPHAVDRLIDPYRSVRL